ncbi:MAG: MBL fold metallo-hydrolase [Promethearchaeota archaeon]|jgi:ribonuclease BN (tRNA processing enzyme)
MKDKLVILGSGGGRHHIRTQHRATGGLLYKFNGIQAHIDPGPGALVRINQFNEDPTKTELFIITHAHVDHYNDVSSIIESSREVLHDKDYNYYKKGVLITTNDVLQYVSDYHLNMLEKVVLFKEGESFEYKGVRMMGTKVIHSPNIDSFGIIFKLKDYSLAYTSDTMVFNGFSEQFSNIDILILNLLRPDSITCKRHLCTDEVIPYLNKISPSLTTLIITHFGSHMDGPRSRMNYVPSQIKKLKEETTIKNIIAAEDGLRLRINELIY